MRVVERGLRLPSGELDLIAFDGETLVFVEVKTRRSTSRGTPALAVDRKKQARMTRAAVHYLKSRKLMGRRARFDVVAIVWPDGGSEPKIEHLRNAFEARDFDGLCS